MKEDFLTYLDDREKGVKSRPGYSAAEKSVMLLSRETLEGIRISGLNKHVFVLLTYLSFLVLSFVELAPFLLLTVPNVEYLLSEKFSQDPLEAYFGKQRYKGGSNSNPSANEFLSNAVSLRAQGSAALDPVRGNSRPSRDSPLAVVDSRPLPKKKTSRKRLADEF